MSRLQLPAFTGLPSQFWVVWLAMLVSKVGRFVVPYLSLYLTESAGVSVAVAGVLFGAYGVGGIFSALGGGVLSDSLGRRSTLMLSLVGTAGSCVLLMVGGHVGLIALSVVLFGLFNHAFQPVIEAMVADIVPAKDRSRAYAHLLWASNFGWTVGPLAAGAAAAVSYQLVFAAEAIACLLSAGLVFFKVTYSNSTEQESVRGRVQLSTRGMFKQTFGDRVFMVFIFFCFIYWVVYIQSQVTLPLVMAESGHGPFMYGVMLSLNGLLLIVFLIPASPWLNRVSHGKVLAFAMVLLAVGFGGTLLATSALAYAVTVTIWTIGELFDRPVSTTVTVQMASSQVRGTFLGVFGITQTVASLVGPPLGTFVLDGYGEAPLWIGCGVLCLMAAAGRLGTSSRLDNRVAHQLT